MAKKTAPYGTWESPITAEAITSNTVGIDNVLVDPDTCEVYHIEKRPSEEGRNFLVNTRTGKDVIDKTSGSWHIRSGVHEYGGGAAIVKNGVFYFSNFADGRVYMMGKEGAIPEPVTPECPAHRFADFDIHPTNATILIAILEDHMDDHPSKVVNSLVLLDTKDLVVTPLVTGADFYASPRFSPDGQRLAWQQWSHPDMPWEGGELHVADINIAANRTISLSNILHIAGKKGQISASYPAWTFNNILLFTSDESGYQNPCTYDPTVKPTTTKPCFPTPIAEDFSGPPWVLGRSPFAVLSTRNGNALFAAIKDGRSVLYMVDVMEQSEKSSQLECPYVDILCLRLLSHPASPKVDVVFIGTNVDEPAAVVHCSIDTTVCPPQATYITLMSTKPAESPTSRFPLGIVSTPQPITLYQSNQPLHVVFYPPTNPAYEGSSLEGEKPPCVCNVHGGPTGIEGQGLSWSKQYFTSRGWCWLDVNYGGSAGYGRAYRDRLISEWGIVDVRDCVEAVKSLSNSAHNQLLDPKRIVIRGGSAGGYTVLAALSIAKQSDLGVFAAGASLYGVSDLRKLAEDTHKFESRYLDKLVGGTFDEVPDVYKSRSPVEHADRIARPLLILQGEVDRVVPKEQAEAIVKSITDRGGRVDYKLYAGEGHGWRQARNIKDALETELMFYQDVLGLK